MYLRRFHLWVDKFLEGRYNNICWFHKKWSSATCGCAGIGRLASLRCLCPNGRTGSTPVSRTIKIATPKGVAIFMVAARNFTCSAEMNSACAKVLASGQKAGLVKRGIFVVCTWQNRLKMLEIKSPCFNASGVRRFVNLRTLFACQIAASPKRQLNLRSLQAAFQRGQTGTHHNALPIMEAEILLQNPSFLLRLQPGRTLIQRTEVHSDAGGLMKDGPADVQGQQLPALRPPLRPPASRERHWSC